MKTILLVEKSRPDLDYLVALFRQWRQDIKVLTAMDETVALQLMAYHPVDIILCALNIPQTKEFQTLSLLITQFPQVPLISIGDNGVDKAREVHQLGACHYHERPLNSELLLDQVNELLETSTSGSVRGIPIHSFLQMLESDAKTCTLQCNLRDKIGFIYMMEGVLLDAECGSLKHEEAMYEMIGWDDATIQIRYFNGRKLDKIKKPLMSIIMEGMRLKDEKQEGTEEQKPGDKTKPRFKRFLTAGHRLSLDFGARVAMEFENIDSPLSSIMVGMVPNSHLIVTIPEHFAVTGTQPEENSGLLVKYLHMGKLCLFKSVILRTIHRPENLLFLSYPSIIHYHELRKAKRVAIFIPCILTLANDTRFSGALIDLSNSGGLYQMLAKKDKVLPDVQIGEKVTIHCLLPGLKEKQKIYGKVRNLHKNSQEARIGIEFLQLRSFIQNTINHYLGSLEQIQT